MVTRLHPLRAMYSSTRFFRREPSRSRLQNCPGQTRADTRYVLVGHEGSRLKTSCQGREEKASGHGNPAHALRTAFHACLHLKSGTSVDR